jgi:Helix-turn-helix domain
MAPTHLRPSAKPTVGRYLTFPEREDIAIELAKGSGIRAIARELGRSPSTISREVRRNAATRSGSFDYRASAAQWHSDRAPDVRSRASLRPTLRFTPMSRNALLARSPAWGYRVKWARCGMEGAPSCSPSK